MDLTTTMSTISGWIANGDSETTNTTITMETTTEDSFTKEVESLLIYQVAMVLAHYYIPVLVPIGLIGNTVSFLVMIKPSNRKISTCIYMAAISINDNFMMLLSLYALLVPTLKVYPQHWFECKVAAFLALFGLQTSTFQVLAMTLDKFIAIKWPHKAAIYSTSRRAKITSVLVFVFTFIYNLPQLYMAKMTGAACLGYANGGMITKVYSWVSFVVNAIIPVSLLIYMNYVIVKTVRTSRKMFGGLQVQGQEQKGEGQGQGRSQGQTKSRRDQAMRTIENQLTMMLLLVTTLFLILMIPTHARFVYTNIASRETPYEYASFLLFYHVSHKFYNTNNGINFFLYCISGRKFRSDLKEILCCGSGSRKYGQQNSSGSGSVATDISSIS